LNPGKLLTYDYVRTAKIHNLPITRVQEQDLSHYPIEKARFRTMPPILICITALTCAYGWVLEKGVVRLLVKPVRGQPF
jgi:hypothetical protein